MTPWQTARTVTGLLFVPFFTVACIGQSATSSPSSPDLPALQHPPATSPVADSCGTGSIVPAASPLRRLSREEYDNTVRDLLGDTSAPAQAFPSENAALGFDNDAESMVVSGLLAEKYLSVAEALAAKADPSTIAPCHADETTCAQNFISTFGRRAFRRALDSGEVARFSQAYSTIRSQGNDVPMALRAVMSALLISPYFLYRVELGGEPAGPAAQKLTGWELASRLSYFLWNSMPDETLLAAAARGDLESRSQMAVHARRMLEDPRANSAVANFQSQWLQLGRIDRVVKDPGTFPDFETLRPLMKAETVAFLEDLWSRDGTLGALFTAKNSFADKTLAAFYGIPGPTSAAFEPVSLLGTPRAGILTQASLMASLASSKETSPIHRGKFVREQLLCQQLAPPPDNFVLPPPSATATTMRERLAQHRANPVCASCHVLMDPIGLGFEEFDGEGRARTTEGGTLIDSSGEIVQPPKDIKQPVFHGAEELGQLLATSDSVKDCAAKQWFRFGFGRADRPGDACSLAQASTGFRNSGGNLRQLLVDLTQTDAFLYRTSRVAEGGSP